MKKEFSPRELKRICKMQEKCDDCKIDKHECAHQVSNYRVVNNCNPCYWTEKEVAESASFNFEFTV